jgi:hypothetical protein
MDFRSRFAVSAISLIALAACGRNAPTSDAALQRDLDLAKGQGLELAPQSRTAVLSADELLPAGNRSRPATPHPTVAHRTPAAMPPAVSEPKVAESPAPAPAPEAAKAPARDSAVAVAPAPATARPSAGAISPPPPGGYKTMGELIRKAPFPINP